MAHKIAVSIQKGGVGKTTTSAIMAEILAETGYKVLVLDLDSQGNATKMLTQRNIYEFSGNTILEAIKEADPEKYKVEVRENLHILPAEDMLATYSRYIYTNNFTNPMHVLKNAMQDIEREYDIIIMDLPPNMGDIVLSAIVYADFVVIPTQCEAFAMDALDRFVSFVQEAKEEGHTDAEIIGILLTMKDDRLMSEKLIAESIRRSYGDLVYKADIKRKARIKDFALMGVTLQKKADLKALEEYILFTEELLERLKERTGSHVEN